MNIVKEYKSIEFALNNYQSRLETIPDELFTVTPPGGGWSYAEVYSHILKATLGACRTYFLLRNLKNRPGIFFSDIIR